jgi:hypothetical protein
VLWPAPAAAPASFVWTTSPSSPGLKIRIETLTFDGESCVTVTFAGDSL